MQYEDSDKMPLDIRYARLRNRVRFWWPAVASFVAGLFLIPGAHAWWVAYREAQELAPYAVRPIVTANVRIVASDAEGTVIELSGYKHAPCSPLYITAYGLDEQRRSDLVLIERIGSLRNRSELVDRPVGPFYAGFWQVGLKAGQAGWLEMSHDCKGTRVITVLHQFHSPTE